MVQSKRGEKDREEKKVSERKQNGESSMVVEQNQKLWDPEPTLPKARAQSPAKPKSVDTTRLTSTL
jgi:hypothetical protein